MDIKHYNGHILFSDPNASTIAQTLTNAVKAGTDLRGAILSDADLWNADLRGADLSGADLSYATLSGADLRSATLSGATLTHTILRFVFFQEANLTSVDFSGTNPYECDFTGAILDKVIGLYHGLCPQEGSFIAFKKVSDGVTLKLLIPEDAKRLTALKSRKCRASHVQVLSIASVATDSKIRESEFPTAFTSIHRVNKNTNVEYRVGQIVTADSYDPDPRNECSGGIHFFMTQAEAEDYTVDGIQATPRSLKFD